jgi:hypothetical protein
MPLAGCETAIPASERTQTHALDRAAAGMNVRNTDDGDDDNNNNNNNNNSNNNNSNNIFSN